MTAARDGGGDRASMMATFMKFSTANDVKIKAVLTADQGKEYQKIADERAAAMKARMARQLIKTFNFIKKAPIKPGLSLF
jgi:hypothetical protein